MQALATLCVAGLFLLLPVQFLVLPLNMSLGDLLGFVVLPLCWFALIQERQRLIWPMAAPIWLLLATTGMAVVASLDATASAMVFGKEIYIYLWFATVASVLFHAPERSRRLVLLAWCAAAFLNGGLIVAQFLDPSLLASMNAMVAGYGQFDLFRPSGLMENSNAAALFQVSAFVPLMTLRPRPLRLALASIVLLVTIAGTGSMGALVAVAAGFVAALATMGLAMQDWRRVVRLGGGALFALAVVAMVVAVLMATVPDIDDRIRYVLTGRGTESAEGRFDLWTQGVEIFLSDLHVFGIGPDVFKRLGGGLRLHNDVLAFAIERGPLALFALLLFATTALAHAVELARSGRGRGDPHPLVFVAAVVAMLFFSLTHEVFRQRPVWMVLALQEALWQSLRRGDGATALAADVVDPAAGDHERAAATMRRTAPMT